MCVRACVYLRSLKMIGSYLLDTIDKSRRKVDNTGKETKNEEVKKN